MSTQDNEALRAVREAHAKGDNINALAAITALLETSRSAEAWDLKGDILLALAQPANAVAAYRRAVTLAPSHALYVHDLGRALLQSAALVEAEAVLQQAAALKPNAWDIHSDLGSAQAQRGFAEAAAQSFFRAVELKPDAAIAQFNLGTALLDLGRLQDAEAAFRIALQLAPRFGPALMSLATLLSDTGRADEADIFFAEAIHLAPRDVVVKQSYALRLLRYGKLEQGFAAYQARFLPSSFALPRRPFTAPVWGGEDLTGKSILIWTEQGLGDEILSANTFQELIAEAGSCTIECSPRVISLFARSFSKARVVPRTDPPHPALTGTFDYQVPAFDIAAITRIAFSEFPQHRGYVQATPMLRDALRAKYQALKPGNMVVGLSWESTARHGARKRLPLDAWRPILDTPDVTFVCLQYGVKPGNADVAKAGLLDRLYIDGDVDALGNLDASASQVAAMDLVITVSNTTAHLAGAQNVPVWTLLPDGPGCFWYWFRDRADSPWYPSMRLFRQPTPGGWQPVVGQVAQALIEMKAQGRL